MLQDCRPRPRLASVTDQDPHRAPGVRNTQVHRARIRLLDLGFATRHGGGQRRTHGATAHRSRAFLAASHRVQSPGILRRTSTSRHGQSSSQHQGNRRETVHQVAAHGRDQYLARFCGVPFGDCRGRRSTKTPQMVSADSSRQRAPELSDALLGRPRDSAAAQPRGTSEGRPHHRRSGNSWPSLIFARRARTTVRT